MELRHVPDVGHGALTGLGHSERSPHEAQETNGEAESLFAQCRDRVVTIKLSADDGELRERRVNDSVLQSGVVAEEQSEDCEEDQQQRKDRENAVVGKKSSEGGAAVLDVFLRHADGEGG